MERDCERPRLEEEQREAEDEEAAKVMGITLQEEGRGKVGPETEAASE